MSWCRAWPGSLCPALRAQTSSTRPLYLLIDVMNLLVLATVLWAIARRTIVRLALISQETSTPGQPGPTQSLMVTHFATSRPSIAGELVAGGEAPAHLPVSSFIGQALTAMSSAEARSRGAVFRYRLHVLILLTFLNYLPGTSKHIHPGRAAEHPAPQPLGAPRLDSSRS